MNVATNVAMDAASLARPDISFVVETRNLKVSDGVSTLDRVLSALSRQTITRDRREVIVTIDPIRHPSLESTLRSSHPDVRTILCPDAHYYRQKNLGARAARADVVGFVDADCDPAPEWAAAVLDAFARHGSSIGAVQGRYLTHSLESSALARAFLVTTFGHQAARTECAVPSLAASNCAFRRDELRERPFREDAVYHGPDLEKALSIRASGRDVLLVPNAVSQHDHEPGLRAMHGRGVYWGYCFLRLRRDGSERVPYGRLFRSLGPLAPLAIVPAKAWIDVRRLVQRRRDLAFGIGATLSSGMVLAAAALSAGVGAARHVAGLPPPPEPQTSTFR